ncbi:MAG TPA: ROK family protein [Candidatus Sulfotelmatobacter sp.]|nr:ROK family protein [Candidatus Sulfotelmatobacter sp.]
MRVEAAWPQAEDPARAGSPADASAILALDLGASRIRAAVVRPDGVILARSARPTPVREGPAAVVAACVAALDAVRHDAAVGGRPIGGLGISAPGPLQASTATLLEPPNLGPAFRDFRLGEALAGATGLPVTMERDTNVAALAEQRFGSAIGVDDFLYLTVSTGIGGAIVAGGRLFTGPDGLAGELGHILVDLDGPPCGCGARGHLEAVASGSGIAAQARRLVADGGARGLAALAQQPDPDARRGPGEIDARLVAAAEAAGDPDAAVLMGAARRGFAAALVGLVDVFTPHLVIVGGSLAQAQGERWLTPAREAVANLAFREAARRTRVAAAALGDDVGLVGAVPLLALRSNGPSGDDR